MRIFFSLFASVFFLTVSSLNAGTKPNILFIMVDDLGYGDLSCYGAPDLKSPNIDALFQSGLRFDQFYANCPVCSPTRAAFLTGLYPDNAGVPGVIRTPLEGRVPNWGNLRNDVKTFPSHMKEAGYDTAIIGKWHLLGLDKPDRPNDVGFDHFHGFLGDMMDDYYNHRRHGINYMRLNEETIDPKGHATDLFSDWTVDYLKDRRETKAPFFLYLAYNAPHTPIQPPTDWIEKVKNRENGITEKRAALVALIEHMDAGIGKVLETLKTKGLSENTIVVFTSDNGGQSSVGARNAPLHGGKQDMWEGGIRVCTSVSWPGLIKPGVNKDHISMTMDFYPTLAEMAGHPVTHSMDGRSFAPILKGGDWQEPQRDIFWVRLEGNQKYGGIPYHAVRRGDWKLLRNTGFEPYQMFNLANDLEEMVPVPKNKAPKKYNELFESLMQHINHAGRYRWQRDNP